MFTYREQNAIWADAITRRHGLRRLSNLYYDLAKAVRVLCNTCFSFNTEFEPALPPWSKQHLTEVKKVKKSAAADTDKVKEVAKELRILVGNDRLYKCKTLEEMDQGT